MRSLAALTLFASVVAATPARAAYALGPGDVLEVAVAGADDFRRRATVDVDGDVSLPFVGEVHASGLTLPAFRAAVAADLARTGALAKPGVVVDIVEYRPFFIGGDVARPGAVPFRPGLTVRVAVALAGGYDALRFRAENPLLSGPEFRSQYESLWTELVRRQARALTLQAELDGAGKADLSPLRSAPLPRATVDKIAALEESDLALRRTARERDRAYLVRAMNKDDADIAALEAAMAQQKSAVDLRAAAAPALRDAAARGVVSALRLAEDGRDLAQLRGQQVDAEGRLATSMRDRSDLARRLDGFADEHRARLGRELQEVVVEVEKIRSQIRSASERLIYVGALKAQLRGTGGAPEVVLHRRGADGAHVAVAADENTAVLPDDMVEVVIRPDQLVVAPTAEGAR